jgi:hypothetical protein
MSGTIEGFYGPPWSHAQRLSHLAFCAAAGFDTYVYAPKDDPYHRRRWRDPYPAAELNRIAELAAAAAERGVRFVYALHPALDMRFADDTEHETLAAKAAQLARAGVRAFALLFDDVPLSISDPDDAARFGPDAGGLGSAHGETVRRFVADFVEPEGVSGPLLVCPTDYAGTAPSPYRDGLAAAAPEDILITWTGADVVVGAVTRADIDAAAASYRRRLVLWDNFPVNDFEPSRVFLGPLTGRTGDLAGSALVGVIGNAMIQPEPSRIPLTTVASWARDPAGYEPSSALASALSTLEADELAPFVRVCSTWPPSADQDPELTTATRAALSGESTALESVERRLSELARCCREAAEPADLVAALRPWLDGALATAEAGLAAVQVLRVLRAEGDPRASVAVARAALDRAEERYENVLRPVVPPFVRAVLDRASPVPAADDRPAVRLIAGDPLDAGPTVDFLREQGFAVRTDGPLDAAAVVVVTRSAGPEELDRLKTAPVPVVAWGGFIALGMASNTSAAMLWHGIDIVDPSDPLAGGRTGRVPLLRGPAWVSVPEVGASARVIARGPDGENGAVLFRYATGDLLVDGTPAPAPRIGLFLHHPGPVRWLLDASGSALVSAALQVALSKPS